MAALNFNPMAHEPLGDGYTVYPAGWYPVGIKSSEVKGTADNKNGYLLLNCEILDGQHKGGIIPVRLNLYHESEGARDFANKALTTICYAVGFYSQLQDSAQLHGLPFQIQIEENEMDYRPGDDRSKPKKRSNDFKAFRDIHGNAPGKPGNGNGPTNNGPSSAPQSQPQGGQPQGGQPPANGWTPPADQNGAQGQGQPQGGGWTPPADQNAGQQQNGGGWQPPAGQGQPQQNAGGWTPPANNGGGSPPASAPWGPPAS